MGIDSGPAMGVVAGSTIPSYCIMSTRGLLHQNHYNDDTNDDDDDDVQLFQAIVSCLQEVCSIKIIIIIIMILMMMMMMFNYSQLLYHVYKRSVASKSS